MSDRLSIWLARKKKVPPLQIKEDVKLACMALTIRSTVNESGQSVKLACIAFTTRTTANESKHCAFQMHRCILEL